VFEGGRAKIYSIELKGGIVFTVAVIYGWSGGAQHRDLAERTDDLISIILGEFAELPDGPRMICGDFNCDLENLQTMVDLTSVTEELNHWTDLGSVAPQWGRPKCAPTCLSYNAKNPTRRDFAIVNFQASTLVTDFQVIDGTDYLVHSPLRISLRYDAEVPDHIFNDGPPPAHLKFTEYVDTFAADDETEFEKQQRFDSHKDQLHLLMDQYLKEESAKFTQLVGSGDTDGFWSLWSELVEKAFAAAMHVGPMEWGKFCGRGAPNLRTRKPHVPIIDPDTKTLQPNTRHFETNRCTMQSKRLTQIAQVVKVFNRGALNSRHRSGLRRALHDHVAAAIENANPKVKF
jgi:hypothetical protein